MINLRKMLVALYLIIFTFNIQAALDDFPERLIEKSVEMQLFYLARKIFNDEGILGLRNFVSNTPILADNINDHYGNINNLGMGIILIAIRRAALFELSDEENRILIDGFKASVEANHPEYIGRW